MVMMFMLNYCICLYGLRDAASSRVHDYEVILCILYQINNKCRDAKTVIDVLVI